MRIRRVTVGALLLVVLAGASLAGYTALRAAGYESYWDDRAVEPRTDDTFTLVALGDSATVAVGALDPMNGYVGRAASLITELTGRPVHVVNLASGGATTADVLERQLPGVDIATADLVLIGTSNDLEQKVPLHRYRDHLEGIIATLPADRTVISDLPLMPGRDPYQDVLSHVADDRGIARADFADVFNGEGHRLDIFSALPPQLSDLGYGYWFNAFRPGIERILEAHLGASPSRSPSPTHVRP